ncbi:MAG: DedA family protein [Planctomycetia bacterium]|nr:DedA family protein [Planctomycetia bacterium]
MDSPGSILDIFLKLDEVLHGVLQTWGPWTYALLFVIILCETGLVVTPFLPGDSLLFAAGAMAALYPDDLNVVALLVLLSIAAVLGDTINYAIGRWLGPRAFTIDKWFLKHEHLERTQQFYERHGGKTIVLARFVPIVRTFAPFVAGVGRMHYPQFLFFNVVGGIAWVLICTLAGYFFGNFPVVKENFELVVVGIVVVSVLPIAWEMWAARRRGR